MSRDVNRRPGLSLADAKFPPRGPLGCRLYRNDLVVNPAGKSTLRFSDVTETAGINLNDYCLGVAAGDYDNDGHIDLYITTYRGGNHLLWNNGRGTFTDLTDQAGVGEDRWSSSAAWVDFDRDGWLDLFACNYVQMNFANHRVCNSPAGASDYCGPQVYTPEPSRLFRNRQDGTFEDVSASSGIANKPGPALGVLSADLNGDGLVDIYVANDGKPNHAWINQGNGTFKEEGQVMGCAVSGQGVPMAGMGVTFGDVDGDSLEDLCVTNLRHEQITLYRNLDKGMFVDFSGVAGLARLSRPYTGFGVGLIDYDNDGWLDLFAANGEVRVIDALLRAGDPFPLGQPNKLYRNLGKGRFEEADGGPALEPAEVSRGAVFGDVDNDGGIDIVVCNDNGPVRLLLNQVGHKKAWLGLRLVTADGKRDALGARVVVERPEAPPLVRHCHTDGSYLCSSDPRVVFGLGDESRILRVVVTWPDGTKEEWTGLPLREYTTLKQGTGSEKAR